MYQDQSVQEKIVNQLMLYRTASQSFCTAHAIHAQMTVDQGNFLWINIMYVLLDSFAMV
jgi:hypothetical protein